MNINRDLWAARRKLYELALFHPAPIAERMAAANVLLNDLAWDYARAAINTRDKTIAHRHWRAAARCYGAAGMLACSEGSRAIPEHTLRLAADRLTRHTRRPVGVLP